jgi:replication factor C large subunit
MSIYKEVTMTWPEIYRPQKVEEMVGNEDARLVVMRWLSKWVNGSKPLLLVGPSGVGKTTLVHVLARQLNYDLIEMNASDKRNREELETLILPAFNNLSVSGRKMLLFLDEVDGISGREDAGGLESIVKMMKEPVIPVIMAANTRDDTKFKALRKVCKVVQFDPIPSRELAMFLDYVLDDQKMDLDPEQRISIIDSSQGDIRSLLNNTQASLAGYQVVRDDIRKMDIASVIDGYFSSKSLQEAKGFLSRADGSYPDPRFGVSPDERRTDKLGALFSSILSSRLNYESMAPLLDVLSKADIIVGRIGRNRQWSLLKYLDSIISYGLFEDSRNKGIKYNQYSMIWPVMAPIFARAQSMRGLLSALAEAAHTSKSIFGSFYFPYMIQIMLDNKIDPREFARFSNLDENAGETLAKEMERARRIERGLNVM